MRLNEDVYVLELPIVFDGQSFSVNLGLVWTWRWAKR